jgi:MFS family permease
MTPGLAQPLPDDTAFDGAQHHLVRDAAWASLTGSLSGGVVLAAFALHLGAGPFSIGLLAALPLMAQVAQLPGIALIERLRRRRPLALPVITAARVLIGLLAPLPFMIDTDSALVLLIAGQALIALLGSLGACAINSWLHQLVPQERRGPFFARRLLWGTLVAGAGSLAAGQAIDYTPARFTAWAFGACFVAAAVAGFVSSWHLARVPEPPMSPRTADEPFPQTLRRPLADDNFRRLLFFVGAWAAVSNIAAPFLTVYLVEQSGYSVGTVTALGVAGQVANAGALFLWGKLTDRVSYKSILATALPLYFVCTALLVLPAQLEGFGRPWIALLLLTVLHMVMGACAGGIGLAAGNLGLKLAPQHQGTPYLAMVGIVTALAGGVAPLLAGATGAWFGPRELSAVLRWQAPQTRTEVVVIGLAHWEFLFLLSALAGLYVMHRLSLVQEEGRVGDRQVVQLFAIEATRSVESLSSIGGALGFLFPFRRFGARPTAPRESARSGDGT